MLIQVGLILLTLVSIAYAAAVMRRIEMDVAEYQRNLRAVEEDQHKLEVACNTLRALCTQVEGDVAKTRSEVTELVDSRAQIEAEIMALSDAPKQRLFMFDRATLGHGKLWEVTITNAGGSAPIPADAAVEWANGRTYIIPGTTDRDAKFRAEPRFLPSMGYRIMKVERFRRA
ncbi:hypothetical protein CHU95_06050 [Niveispirillum lacus]|uniref:Uncharacterized protein n=1 Tax=Niveispirillum lacus TaxID=1981099 RepID=A0A255Z305_9PROT|nr:hypothetical protein [Niveispirillum lacus]OYQ35832.1 hypothetical protein CHU95_06050 [Niveispirillum lacus]